MKTAKVVARMPAGLRKRQESTQMANAESWRRHESTLRTATQLKTTSVTGHEIEIETAVELSSQGDRFGEGGTRSLGPSYVRTFHYKLVDSACKTQPGRCEHLPEFAQRSSTFGPSVASSSAPSSVINTEETSGTDRDAELVRL